MALARLRAVSCGCFVCNWVLQEKTTALYSGVRGRRQSHNAAPAPACVHSLCAKLCKCLTQAHTDRGTRPFLDLQPPQDTMWILALSASVPPPGGPLADFLFEPRRCCVSIFSFTASFSPRHRGEGTAVKTHGRAVGGGDYAPRHAPTLPPIYTQNSISQIKLCDPMSDAASWEQSDGLKTAKFCLPRVHVRVYIKREQTTAWGQMEAC